MLKPPAFTLIELLVVTTIMIILMSIGIASFSSASKGARDAKRKSDLETIRQAMVMYKAQNGEYASTQAGLTGPPAYISLPFPQDPNNSSTPYVSKYDTAAPVGEDFCFCAVLELGRGNHDNSSCTGAWANNSGGFYCVKQP